MTDNATTIAELLERNPKAIVKGLALITQEKLRNALSALGSRERISPKTVAVLRRAAQSATDTANLIEGLIPAEPRTPPVEAEAT